MRSSAIKSRIGKMYARNPCHSSGYNLTVQSKIYNDALGFPIDPLIREEMSKVERGKESGFLENKKGKRASSQLRDGIKQIHFESVARRFSFFVESFETTETNDLLLLFFFKVYCVKVNEKTKKLTESGDEAWEQTRKRFFTSLFLLIEAEISSSRTTETE